MIFKLTIPFFIKAEILSKLDKVTTVLQQSKRRLDKISTQSQERILIETEEDKHSNTLRNWCLKIRSEVLVPSGEAQSEITRPLAGGTMPPIMNQVIAEAQYLGISDLPDVKKMIDCFNSTCWSFSAMGILRQKPSISQVSHLISEASKFKLPDEKAVRTMKFMANRASQWQLKIHKALSPKAGETKPINVSILQELECGIRESPLIVPEEQILRIVIEDNGIRYCTCGGPYDGKLMLYCDICDKRFHGACMEMEKVLPDGQIKWSCPCCSGREHSADRKLNLESSVVDAKGPEGKSTFVDSKEDVSPHAPDPIQLWPPFGLLDSQTAIEAFGSECLAIPNVTTTDANTNAQNSTPQLGGSLCSNVLISKDVIESSEVEPKDKASDLDVPAYLSDATQKVFSEVEPNHETSDLDIPSCLSETAKR